MILMIANHSSPRMHYLAGKHPNRLGWLIGPTAREKTKLRKWMPYALDNDAFSAWTKQIAWDEDNWRALLEWAKASGQTPRWLLVPDEVANKDATLEKWKRHAPEARSYGWPLAFAVQDGMTPDDVPDDADIVFVGGTTDWKWANVTTFTSGFDRVHVGRVNGIANLLKCEDAGAESCDGTGWARDPSDPRKFDAIELWLAGSARDQLIEIGEPMSLKIYCEYGGDDGIYRLMVDDGRMSATPCGPRLFRAEPHPRIAFTHDTIEAAEADAQKLRAYLAALPTKRGPKKRTAESAA